MEQIQLKIMYSDENDLKEDSDSTSHLALNLTQEQSAASCLKTSTC